MTRSRPKTMILATAAALAVLGGIATAAVVVYKNDFSTRGKFKQVRKFEGGKVCKRAWQGKRAYATTARRGKSLCSYRTPVEGSTAHPDHEVQARVKMRKKTAKGIMRRIFVGLAVRANRKGGYQLHVFPKSKRWRLVRKPRGEGFPVTGTDRAINGFRKRNKLRLRAFGDRVVAFANKKKLAALKDTNPRAEVTGRKTLLLLGHRKKSKQEAKAFFDNLKVKVPSP